MWLPGTQGLAPPGDHVAAQHRAVGATLLMVKGRVERGAAWELCGRETGRRSPAEGVEGSAGMCPGRQATGWNWFEPRVVTVVRSMVKVNMCAGNN